MEKKDPLALHEPNAEALARGYLRGAVVRWNGGEGAELGIVIGHDVEGDPMVVFPTHDRSCPDAISMDPTKTRLALLRPAPAPAPAPSVDPELARLLRHDCPDPDGPETPLEGARRLVETLRAARAQHEKIAEALNVSPASEIATYADSLANHARGLEAERARLRAERDEIAKALGLSLPCADLVAQARALSSAAERARMALSRLSEAFDRERSGAESARLRARETEIEIVKALGFGTFYTIPGVLARIEKLVDLERKTIERADSPKPAPAPPTPDLHRAFVAGAEWGAAHPGATADYLDALESAGLE